MFPHQGGQGPVPPSWNPQQPNNGSYHPPPAPPSHINSSLPPPPPQEPRPDMAAHHQQQPQHPYRLPGPNEWTRGPPPPDPYRQQPDPYRQQPPPPPNYMNQHHQPPAPRQRTAIACRYCRRRKIRCSGFEATDDGRCSNCMRFNQDCIFTPVSAQTQAFVPAHTVWRGVGQPPPMYGAYGQPLPPAQHAEAYGQPPRQPQQQAQQPQGQQAQQYLPSPTAGPYQAHSAYSPTSGAPLEEAGRDMANGRKRPYSEPHTPTLPPPNPGSQSQIPQRSTGQDYKYPDPTSLTSAASPANSTAPYSAPPPPTAAQPYYASHPQRRGSPQSAYTYESSRASSSPHTQALPALGLITLLPLHSPVLPPSNHSPHEVTADLHHLRPPRPPPDPACASPIL